eukprot:scpid84387/ scgid15106/ 
MMRRLSEASNLSQSYTNHCLRATSITLMKFAGIEDRKIMAVSGHKNVQSLQAFKIGLLSLMPVLQLPPLIVSLPLPNQLLAKKILYFVLRQKLVLLLSLLSHLCPLVEFVFMAHRM